MPLCWLPFLTGAPSDDALEQWLAWLFTYWLHSALMCGVATLLARFESAPLVRQRLWQAAMVLPFATSLFALTEPFRELHPSVIDCLSAVASRLSAAETLATEAPPALSTLSSAPQVNVGASNGQSAWETALNVVTMGILAAWAGAAAARLLRLVFTAHVLRHKLRARRVVNDARLLQRLRQVSTQALLPRSVVLTTLPDVAGPFILGRAEICVPTDTLTAFSDAEVDAVFAHELAHLERRDWLTFPVISVLGSILCVQPLNLWLAARFRNDAELACDDRAVELTNDPEGLARALLRVAERVLSTRSLDLLPAMARPKGVLLARARRLLPVYGGDQRSRSAPRWRSSIAALALVACLSPALGMASRTPRTTTLLAANTGTSTLAHGRVAPDPTQLALELNGLQQRELHVQGELATLHSERASNLGAAQRLLELEQELRHLQETHVWLQQRGSN
jgi:bla regulator protein blaR1